MALLRKANLYTQPYPFQILSVNKEFEYHQVI